MVHRTRLLFLISGVGFLVLLTATLRHAFRQHPISPVAPAPPVSESAFAGYGDAKCPSAAPWLSNINVPRPYDYVRRDIVVRPQKTLLRRSVTDVDKPLMSGFEGIDETNADAKLSKCPEPLFLDVPAWPEQRINASHLAIGIATSLSRLEDSLPFLQRWLPHSNAKFIVIVNGEEPKADDPADRTAMRQMEHRLRAEMGIDATLILPYHKHDPMPIRYFSLVRALYDHRTPSTQWGIILDDDCIFPSLSALVSELARHTRPPNDPETQELYLGGMSEEWWTVAQYSFMAMGGASIILSLPLLRTLHPHYADCISSSFSSAGDNRIFECIKAHSNARLTHVPGLYQSDLAGDRSGFYESGRKILSLHHWKGWWWDFGEDGTPILGDVNRVHQDWWPMDAMTFVTDVCDTCFLQRWRFSDDVVISNGYSIAQYPSNATEKSALERFEEHRGLDKMEHTMGQPRVVENSLNEGFEHYFGILRPKLELESEKLHWMFLHAVKGDGGVRQWYFRRGDEEKGRRDQVVELFWIREEEWRKGGGEGGF